MTKYFQTGSMIRLADDIDDALEFQVIEDDKTYDLAFKRVRYSPFAF